MTMNQMVKEREVDPLYSKSRSMKALRKPSYSGGKGLVKKQR